MKFKILNILILNLLILFNFSLTLSVSNQEELERADLLNTILEKELSTLDELSAILQYIGQAINKGAIKIENKKETQSWVKNNQKYIKIITGYYKFPLDESQLNFISSAIENLNKNLIENFEDNFNRLQEPDFPLVSRNKNIDLEKIQEKVDENNNITKQLQAKANSLGLTKVNLTARYLDNVNNKYKITKALEYFPYAALATGAAVYFTPTKYFNDFNILTKIKNFIGTSRYTDPDEFENNKTAEQIQKEKENAKGKGYFYTLLQVLSSKDFKGLGTLAGLVTLGAKSAPWSPVTNYLKDQIQGYWDQLKGYQAPNNKTYKVIEDITLDDERLVGIEDQVDELKNLVRYITNPEIYDRSNTSLEKGVLLAGPSRTGKTLAARGLCGTLNKVMLQTGEDTKFSFREIKWGEVRWTSEGIKTIIEEAKRNAPCVIFIDEIHNLPLQTKEGGETLTEFLTGMSGINSENDSRHQVILLAATNMPELLDSALLQPGRFGTIIHFEKPNYKNRKKYFEVVFKSNSIDTSDIDIDSLVRQTSKCSYGDLEYIIKNARFISRTLAKGVAQSHLQSVIDKHVHRLKDEVELTGVEKKYLATNQAGKALAYLLLDPEEKLEMITIKGKWKKIKESRYWDTKQKEENAKVAQAKYGSTITYNSNESTKIQSNLEKEKLCKIKVSGYIAQKIILGDIASNNQAKDKKKAFEIAQTITFSGLNKNDLPKEVAQKLNQESYDLLIKFEKEIEELFIKNKDKIKKIADELINKNSLNAKEIRLLVNL